MESFDKEGAGNHNVGRTPRHDVPLTVTRRDNAPGRVPRNGTKRVAATVEVHVAPSEGQSILHMLAQLGAKGDSRFSVASRAELSEKEPSLRAGRRVAAALELAPYSDGGVIIECITASPSKTAAIATAASRWYPGRRGCDRGDTCSAVAFTYPPLHAS